MDELLAAVADCDTETIAECLDAGADLHHVGLIHEAVSTDDMQVVTLLLGRGAQVNQRDANGRTPLHCAQSRGVADVLLRSGADVTARDASGLTLSTWWLKLVSYTCSIVYNLEKEYPFSTYAESAILAIESTTVLVLVAVSFAGGGCHLPSAIENPSRKGPWWLGVLEGCCSWLVVEDEGCCCWLV